MRNNVMRFGSFIEHPPNRPAFTLVWANQPSVLLLFGYELDISIPRCSCSLEVKQSPILRIGHALINRLLLTFGIEARALRHYRSYFNQVFT